MGAKNCRCWLVSGRVQGVAFRWYTTQAARQLGIVGTARNLPDGRVEILFVEPGDPSVLDEFQRRVERGPDLSRVDGIEAAEVPVDVAQQLGARRGFDIVY